MKPGCALLTSVVLALPASWAQDAAAPAVQPAPQEETPALSPIDALFQELLAESQELGRLLNEVTDKESADRVAGVLTQKMHHLDDRLHALETYPFDHRQDTEALKSHMAALTHISQSHLATMQRLVEVNAYGSEALMAVFARYKIDNARFTSLQAEDLPQTRFYSELADALEAALYALHKVKDEASAQASPAELRPLLKRIEAAHHMLAQLAPPRTDEQKEALRPEREKVQKLSNDLKEEITRLQAARCFFCTELDALLPRLLGPAAS